MTVIMRLRGDCAGWLQGYSHAVEIYVAIIYLIIIYSINGIIYGIIIVVVKLRAIRTIETYLIYCNVTFIVIN